MKLTIALKLTPTPEQHAALLETMQAFNAACDFIAGVAFEAKTANKIAVQKLCYYEVREKFGLSSQMTVRAIAKVCEVYKRDKKIKPHFSPTGAIVYDYRLMSFKGLDKVSLLTLGGREIIPMVFGEYQAARTGRIKGQADLVYRNGIFYLYAVIDLPEPPQTTPDEFLGIDLGLANIATDSDGVAHCGKATNGLRRRHAALRRKLQKKGTKAAKRLLKMRRRKEQRWARDKNHCLSKTIVAKAKDTGRGIALEDLKGIRDRVRLRKAQRLLHHSWSFHQLRSFLEYKARMAGVLCMAVDPRNTSRTCPECGHCEKANRKTQSLFHCLKCDFSGHADSIAAGNIARRAASHAAARLDCVTVRDKPAALAVGS